MQLHRKHWLRQLKTLQPLLSHSEHGQLFITPEHVRFSFVGGEITIRHAGWDGSLTGMTNYRALFGVLNKAPEALLELNPSEGDKLNLVAEGSVYTIPFFPRGDDTDYSAIANDKTFTVMDVSYSAGAVLAATTQDAFTCYLVKEKRTAKLKLIDGSTYSESLLPGEVSPAPFSFQLGEHIIKFLANAHILELVCTPVNGRLILEGEADGFPFTLHLTNSAHEEPLWDEIIPDSLPENWCPMSTALGKLPRVIELITATSQNGKTCPIRMSYQPGLLGLESLAETEISIELADIHAGGLDEIEPFEVRFDALRIKNILTYAEEWQVLDGRYLLFKDGMYSLYCVGTIS